MSKGKTYFSIIPAYAIAERINYRREQYENEINPDSRPVEKNGKNDGHWWAIYEAAKRLMEEVLIPTHRGRFPCVAFMKACGFENEWKNRNDDEDDSELDADDDDDTDDGRADD